MATFFKNLFGPRLVPSTSRQATEDTYQEITDSQPQNVFQEVLLLQGHRAPVKCLTKINSSHFATASDDHLVIIWDSEHGTMTSMFHECHTAPITAMLSFSNDKSPDEADISDCTILTSSRNELVMWELESGVNPRICDAHQGPINCLCLLQHNMVCSGGKDICLWDIPSGKLLSKYDRSQCEDDKSEICYLLEIEGRNFGIIAVSDYFKPAFYEIKKSTVTQTVQYHLQFNDYLLSFHSRSITYMTLVSGTLFATGAEDGTVILWSVNSLNAIKKFEGVKDDFSDSNSLTQSISSSSSIGSGPIAVVSYIMVLCERFLFVAVGNGFKVFDVFSSDSSPSAHEIQSIHKPLVVHTQAHTARINRMEFLSSCSMLVTASSDGTVRLWKPNVSLVPFQHKTTQPEDHLKYSVEVFCGVHSANQQTGRGRKKSISGSQYPTVPVLVGELVLHSDAVQSVVDLGCDKGIATCGDDGLVLLWKNLELEDEKRDFKLQKRETYYDATS